MHKIKEYANMDAVTNYILENWEKTIVTPRETAADKDGLPYPYVVPTIGTMFHELYYWDTYFTCLGLQRSDRFDLVKDSAENLLYLISKYGYVPNSSHSYRNRSQPPFLSELVRLVFEQEHDLVFLRKAYEGLTVEYEFWMNRRMTPCGLNQYGINIERAEILETEQILLQRIGYKETGTEKADDVLYNLVTNCESGWDINPRMGFAQRSCAWVDLNSLLFQFEKNMAFFAEVLQTGEADRYDSAAEQRGARMRELMFDGQVFCDYNYMQKQQIPLFSAAAFYPLWAGVATDEQAASCVSQLYRIEAEYGIVACEGKKRRFTYQWDFPNGWPPVQYLVIQGLRRYGYEAEARRLAKKYLQLVQMVFAETGNLWEKYNVIEPKKGAASEYGTPSMLGWTAGVYLWCREYLSGSSGAAYDREISH